MHYEILEDGNHFHPLLELEYTDLYNNVVFAEELGVDSDGTFFEFTTETPEDALDLEHVQIHNTWALTVDGSILSSNQIFRIGGETSSYVNYHDKKNCDESELYKVKFI
ncbi:MAG: hypothetical protein JEY94_19070 [Melioribacteraceae bacterium]|nr:hypothetical protein [Melioribacteraceae bacterium]